MSEQVSDSTQRVISIPELLRNILFSLPRLRDTYHSALVCRIWSEIALDALWYEVDDLCILLNLLVPLTSARPGIYRTFIRCPTPEDWIHFERYSRRVRTLLVDYDTPLPAQSVFAEIGRTRIRPEILPNLWSLHLFGDNYLCAIFLHSGIRDLAVHLDLSSFETVSLFLHHARFFSRSLVTLEIRTGRIAGSDPHPVGCIATGLSSWLFQLQDLEELTLPRFWNTTYVCKVLSQLPRLSHVGFEYYERNGYGNPIDTLTFNPMHSEADRGSILFPSLISFSQNAPFSESIQFITSWQHSSRLTDLILESQILETPDSFRSGLLSIADGCPLLSKLGLACLITTYLDHPGVAAPSRSRITLDVLLPLHKLNHLLSFEIAHTLPIALTDDDFVALVKPWHKLERLGLGPDPYPFGSDNVHTATSPLSHPMNVDDPQSVVVYPIPGLWKSIKSLRKHCPMLTELFLFGIDDFPTEEEQASFAENEPTLLPFPQLTMVSFQTSLLTSNPNSVALALSEYFLPDVSFVPNKTWGGDGPSRYLTFLNLRPLIPLQDQIPGRELRTWIQSATPDVFDPAWSRASPSLDSIPNEPIGVDGFMEVKTDAELDRRKAIWDKVADYVSVLSKARLYERKKAKGRVIDGDN